MLQKKINIANTEKISIMRFEISWFIDVCRKSYLQLLNSTTHIILILCAVASLLPHTGLVFNIEKLEEK